MAGDPAEPLVLVLRRQGLGRHAAQRAQHAGGQPKALPAPAARRAQRLQTTVQTRGGADPAEGRLPVPLALAQIPGHPVQHVTRLPGQGRQVLPYVPQMDRRQHERVDRDPDDRAERRLPQPVPDGGRAHRARGDDEHRRGRGVDALVAEARPVRQQHQHRNRQGEGPRRVIGDRLCARRHQGPHTDRRELPGPLDQRAVDGGLHQDQRHPRCHQGHRVADPHPGHQPGQQRRGGRLQRLHEQVAFPAGAPPRRTRGARDGAHVAPYRGRRRPCR